MSEGVQILTNHLLEVSANSSELSSGVPAVSATWKISFSVGGIHHTRGLQHEEADRMRRRNLRSPLKMHFAEEVPLLLLKVMSRRRMAGLYPGERTSRSISQRVLLTEQGSGFPE